MKPGEAEDISEVTNLILKEGFSMQLFWLELLLDRNEFEKL